MISVYQNIRNCSGRNGICGPIIIGILFLVAAYPRTAFPQTSRLHIPFLETLPVIDGLPDKFADEVQWHEFGYSEKSAETNPDVSERYKLMYDYSFLYLIVESGSDSIVCRDRAYQNGDGLHLVVARPDSDRATDQFYVLRFSPPDISRNIPAGKRVWYYNVDLGWKALGAKTKFACRSDRGKSYFELLLSWDDVYPYNPVFSDSIGINLCFVKAIGDKEKNYYFIKYDDRIQSELSRRKYADVIFEKPNRQPVSSYAILDRRNIQIADSLNLRIISSTDDECTRSYRTGISSADGFPVSDSSAAVRLSRGFNVVGLSLPVRTLAPGDYTVRWSASDNSNGESAFTVLPRLNYKREVDNLDALRNRTTQGNYNTLRFMLESIFRDYSAIKPYETAGRIGENFISYHNYVSRLSSGTDSLANSRGIFRRAFVSGVDSSLQPYSIKVPKDFSPEKVYPLFVMLHGSGSDDRDVLDGKPLTQGNFIEIAPYGRGTSNCFTTDGAQTDVREAIEDAIRNYPIDTTRIIIAGFSMGGYGAYRIFYEFPKMFRGVAVFSGHPDLASRWIGPGHPNFLDEKYLKPFANIHLFIYHNRNDLNCPYELTEELVGKLRAAGAVVEFVTTDSGGHSLIDDENLNEYYDWLNSAVR